MEAIVLIVLFLLAFVGGMGALFTLVPFGRWSFEYGGRTFQVHNYALREVIMVDGVVVQDTRVATDWMTYASHAIKLPDGQQLDIVIGTSNGLTVQCTARVGDQVVFDSSDHRAPTGTARATLPGTLEPTARSATTDADAEPDDPRWAPARVLLDELVADPEVAESALTLRTALLEAFSALERAQKSAAAHRALGAAGDDLDVIVAHREGSVTEVLGLLRQLHLAASTRDVGPAPSVQATLGRLEAEREVDEAALRRAAAQRARASEPRQS